MPEIIIAVDALGGDNAPGAIVEGCILALREYTNIRILFCGPTERIKPLLSGADDVIDRIEIREAPDEIDIHEPPVMAVRRKTNSSLVAAMLAVKNGEAQAVLSAGSTGAVLAGGMLRVGRIKGIERPALAPVLPGAKNPFLLIDCGANVDCQPKYLEQFGLMGSVYMQKVLGVKEPNVCLANIGAEAEKGDALTKDAYKLMESQRAYKFGGNVEGRDIPTGIADVVVADGFAGNLILKYTEGLAATLMGMLKDEMMASTRAKLGAMLLKPALRKFKKRMDSDEYGGAPLLGVEGAVVKAHGSSKPLAIKSAVRQARDMVMGDIVGLIKQGLAEQIENSQH